MKQGIVMEIQAKRAIIFTSDLDMIEVPTLKNMFIGQSVQLPEAAMTVTRPRRWLVPALAAACLVLLVCTGLLLSMIVLPKPGPVYLSLDINPSVEFTLDADRQVTDAVPLNAEAWELLQQTDLKGLSYAEAIGRWIAIVRLKMPDKLEQVLISAVVTRRDRDFVDQIMALDSTRSTGAIPELNDLAVKVLYTMDPSVKTDADTNRISYGRQLLFNQARSRQLTLDLEAIKSTSLKSLLEHLATQKVSQTIETSGEPTKPSIEATSGTKPNPTEPTESASPSSGTGQMTGTLETTAVKEQTSATTDSTTKPVTQSTTKSTTKATTKPAVQATTTSTGIYQLQAVTNSAEGWKLQWTLSPESRTLNYYKVVISKSVTAPKYPDNGYLYALSRSQNTCQVNNASAYNGGDVGGYLIPGQAYYVSITYVFTDGKAYSNTIRLTYNGPAKTTTATTTKATTQATSSFTLRVATSGNNAAGITLNWDISPEDRTLSYYKIVISASDSTPQYPDNGYLYAITNRSTLSCQINNANAYNGGDFGGKLTPGNTYYFAVTYCFSDGSKITSNVLQLTYNGPAA